MANKGRKAVKKPQKQKSRRKARKPRTRRRKVRQVGARNPFDSMLRLSECAARYACAISDPWSACAYGACIPIASEPTQKITGFIRGSGAVGVNGLGFILLTPTFANDIPSLAFTDATFVGTDVEPFSATNVLQTGVGLVPCTNLLHSTADFGTGVSGTLAGRVVSAGLRVWCTAPAVAMGGTVYAFRDPRHLSAQFTRSNLPQTPASLGVRRECEIVNFDRTAIEIADFASRQDELELITQTEQKSGPGGDVSTSLMYPFSDGNFEYRNSGGATVTFAVLGGAIRLGRATTVIAIQSSAGNTFQFEYIVHCEVSGEAVQSVATRTAADIEGTQRVLSAANSAQTSTGQGGAVPTLGQRLMSGLASMADELKPVAVNAGRFALNRAMASRGFPYMHRSAGSLALEL